MRSFLLSLTFFVLPFSLVLGQCDADHDFNGQAFGVSPDPLEYETFDDGMLGEPYSDTLHLIVPTDAGDIIEDFAGAPVDSVVLQDIRLFIGPDEYSLEDIGLTTDCNNLGSSPNACTMYGGQQGCARLYGTPTFAGEYTMEVEVTGWTTIFENAVSQAIIFDQYTLFIDGVNSIQEISILDFELGQNSPNPFDESTTINFSVDQASLFDFKVMSLLGEIVVDRKINAESGMNKIKVDGNEFAPGIYLYSLESKGQKITKRMVVNH